MQNQEDKDNSLLAIEVEINAFLPKDWKVFRNGERFCVVAPSSFKAFEKSSPFFDQLWKLAMAIQYDEYISIKRLENDAFRLFSRSQSGAEFTIDIMSSNSKMRNTNSSGT